MAVWHGTYRKHVEAILANGLSPMKREHIHMQRTSVGSELRGQCVISGMRTDSEIIIEIDARACVENGYELLESANGVILCGSSIPPEYFLRVLDRSSGVDLLHPDSPADQSVRCPQDVIASLQEKLRLQQDQYEILNAEFAEYKRNHDEKC